MGQEPDGSPTDTLILDVRALQVPAERATT
jgi:hypothetical protein